MYFIPTFSPSKGMVLCAFFHLTRGDYTHPRTNVRFQPPQRRLLFRPSESPASCDGGDPRVNPGGGGGKDDSLQSQYQKTHSVGTFHIRGMRSPVASSQAGIHSPGLTVRWRWRYSDTLDDVQYQGCRRDVSTLDLEHEGRYLPATY